jgi:hypothetical protein
VPRIFSILLAILAPSVAHARAQSDVPYSLGEAFSVAMRFVRVDRGCEVTDKDPAAAFVTFSCKDDEKVKRGSVEIFQAKVNGREGVRLQVALGDDPHYVELRFLELLERKLREERGTPPQAPPAAPPAKKPPPDGGESHSF